jgi:hypothetical protein
MNYTVQELAIKYAEALTRYHEIKQQAEVSDLEEDHKLLRDYYDVLFAAQDKLSAACARQAELNVTA